MTMDTAKLEKMKVAELRNELQIRGLDTKGVKAVLIERLKAAIDNKTPVEGGTSEITEISTPSRRSRRTRSMTRSPSPSPVKKAEPTLEPLIEEDKTETIKPELEGSQDEKNSEDESQLSVKKDQDEQEKSKEEDKNEEDEEMDTNDQADSTCVETETSHSELPPENIESVEKTVEPMDVDKSLDSKKEGDSQKEHVTKTEESEKHVEKKDKRLSRKRSHSKSKSRSKSRSRSRTRDRSRSRSRSKNSRSRSPRVRRSTSRSKNIDESTNEEDEPVIEDKQFGLSWLDSDLHLTIDPVTFTSAKPMSQEIYSLVWSGARTNYGVREGKVCYEVRLAEETNVNQFKDEPFIRGLRCGFSTTKTNLLLGEGENSFAYCETGKKALNGEFIDYGKPFKLDDVIGCYLDLDSSPSTIQFTLNGEELGTAFEFSKEILGEEDALFPHILIKGYEVSVNFADSENLLGNAERPVRMRKKEKPRKDSSKSEDASAKDTSNTEDNWEIVDEAKMDDTENDDEKKEEEVKDDEEPSKIEEKPEEENKSNEDESVEEEKDDKVEKSEESDEKKEDTKEDKTTEDDSGQNENQEKEDEKESKKSLPEDAKENGHTTSDKKKKKRDSKDSHTEYVMEEIEPEERDEVVLLSGYELIALTPEDKFISGPQRPESRKDCEVYLLVGLPGSGKTHWALNHIKENPEKRYHTIGADDLISKMTIDGKPRKPLHKGNWDRVYELCLQSLSALEEIATKRRRNYILDQTNAFASAQRRKMKGFGDFKRNAVVCIPSEEELKKRNQLKTEAGTENAIKESTLNNLKASFTLPSLEFGWFDNIIYTDLKDDEAKDEVKRYNEKGSKDIDASRDKRPRRDNRQRDDRRRYEDRRRDDFRGPRWKGNSNDRRGGSGNRWGPPSRGSSAPWRDDRGYGGGGGGRSYDNRNNRYSSGGGGGSQNWVNNNRNRYDDRFSGRSGGNSSGGGRSYDSYGGGSRDYRDRGRDRNGDGGDSGSRRDGGYRSGNNQRDFRSGHRDNRTEDSRGGFERSKYSSNDDGYAYQKPSGQGKWVQMPGGGNWVGQQQLPQQEYWNYDQSQGYGNQQQAQWPINNADPRQQQWANWYQNNSQQQQGTIVPDNTNQQYWSQYSYPNQGGTTAMSSHSSVDGSLKK